MVLEKLKRAFGFKKKRKFGREVAGAAAVAGLVATAKAMHDKGYDKKAVKMLKDSAETLKEEAQKLEGKVKKEIRKEIKKRKKLSNAEIEAIEKKASRLTKAKLKSYAAKEFGIRLSTNDLKKEMISKLVLELEQR